MYHIVYYYLLFSNVDEDVILKHQRQSKNFYMLLVLNIYVALKCRFHWFLTIAYQPKQDVQTTCFVIYLHDVACKIGDASAESKWNNELQKLNSSMHKVHSENFLCFC